MDPMPRREADELQEPDALDRLRQEVWLPDELRPILAHQLATPLHVDLPAFVGQAQAEVQRLAAQADPPITTFRDLLLHPRPPVELLKMVQRFAAATQDRRPLLPAAVARVLHTLSRALIWRSEGTDVSMVDSAALQDDLAWVSEQEWVEPEVRALATESRTAVASSVASGEASPQVEQADQMAPAVAGYEITGRLGEGGMGTVWRAIQTSTRRPVALKLLGGLGSPRARQRFQREVELASRLEHPNIARVYDSGADRGVQYYAMELIEGAHLDRYARDNRLEPRQVLSLMQQVCLAVQHAHQRGVIHRDIKPSNILITFDGRPHIVDFGLAKALAESSADPTITMEGQYAGTPAFMAPEQAAGRVDRIDTRTDVWGLGAVLYLLLTGKTPHAMEGPRHEVMQRLARQEVRLPRRLNRRIDSELEAMLMKALAQNPEHRYGSAGELAQDIDNYLQGSAISARTLTVGYFLRKRVRKHWVPVLMVALIVCLLLGVTIYAFVRIDHARDEALAAKGQATQDAARAAESAKEAMVRVADMLVAQGDALGADSRWLNAVERYHEAYDTYRQMGVSPHRADYALVEGYRHARPALNAFIGHTARVGCVALSPDETLLATGSDDATLRLWDLRTGRCIRTFIGHGRPITCVSFSPDGRQLLSGSRDRTIRLWDLNRDDAVKVFLGHTADVWNATFSPDGQRIASSGFDRSARLWNVQTGQQERLVVQGYPLGTQVAFSGDGRHLAVGGGMGELHLYEVETGRQLWGTQAQAGYVAAIAFSPDGRWIVSGTHGREVTLYSREDGSFIRHLGSHAGPLTAVRFLSDSRQVLTACTDGAFRRFEVETGQMIHATWASGVGEGAAWSANGSLAVSGGRDGVVRLWSLAEHGPTQLLQGHTQEVHHLAVSSDGLLAASVAVDGTARVWDLATGRELRRIDAPHDHFGPLAFSPQGDMLLTSGPGEVANLYETATGRLICPFSQFPGEIDVAVEFAPQGDRILLASGNRVMIRDMQGTLLHHLRLGHGVITHARFADQGKRVLAISERGFATIWDTQIGEPLTSLNPPAKWGKIAGRGAVLSGGDVAFCNTDQIDGFGLWDVRSGKLLHPLKGGHTSFVRCVALSPDDRLGVSGGEDNSVRLWDLEARQELRAFLEADHITTLRFAPDGRRLLIASGATCRILDLAWPDAYRALSARLAEVRPALGGETPDPAALAVLGEWYAFRGRWDWAAALLEEARKGGIGISPLLLGRCYWQMGANEQARIEFGKALERNEAPERYLRMCIQALDPSAPAGR